MTTSIIVDLKSCRVCLLRNGSISVFEKRNKMILADMITECTNLQIKQDDDYPKNICDSCVVKVVTAYSFKIECHNSNSIIQMVFSKESKNEFEAEYLDEWQEQKNNNILTENNTVHSDKSLQDIKKTDNSIENSIAFVDISSLESNNECYLKRSIKNNIKKLNKLKRISNKISKTKKTDLQQPISDGSNKQLNQLKMFSCSVCCKLFDQNETLSNHIKKNHLNIIQTDNENKLGIFNHKLENEINDDYCETTNRIDDKHNTNITLKIELLNVDDDNMKEENDIETCYNKEKDFNNCSQTITSDEEDDNISQHEYEPKISLIDDSSNLNYQEKITSIKHKKSTKLKINKSACIKKYVNKKLLCNICCNYFTTKSELHRHSFTHTETKRFKCDLCFKSFKSKISLVNHKREHNGDFLECTLCDKTYTSQVAFKNHIQTHSGKLKCDICDNKFSTVRSLTVHKKRHENKKEYICEICSKQFLFHFELRKHHKIAHLQEKPFKCSVCERSFCRKSILITHERIHTGEKPYKCKFCNKLFRDSSTLSIHLKVHTGEKHYQCEICFKNYSRPSHLICHKRVHTGEKPFKCELCKMDFDRNHALQCHLRIHTGERPYKCQICNKTFRLQHCYQRHLGIHKAENKKCKFCNSTMTTTNLCNHMKYDCKKNRDRIEKNLTEILEDVVKNNVI